MILIRKGNFPLMGCSRWFVGGLKVVRNLVQSNASSGKFVEILGVVFKDLWSPFR